MSYSAEEQHLAHANEARGIEQVQHDLQAHFVSAGVQQKGGVDLLMHQAPAQGVAQVAATEDGAAVGELQHELREMARHHGEDGTFVLGVETHGGFEFADEEGDAE